MASIIKRQWSPARPPRWEARVSVGGKQHSRSFPTKREAQAWAADQEGRTPTGTRTDNKLLSAAVEAWGDGTPGRKHLADNLGDLALIRVGAVTTDDVKRWRAGLVAGRDWAGGKPLAASTVNTLTRTLSAFFNEQVANGQLGRNPVLGARSGLGRVSKSQTAVDVSKLITLSQVRAIRDRAGEPLRTMIELMATTGLRPNEVAGLRVRSVDLDGGVVHVTEQAAGSYGDWAWRALKSDAATRSVPLPASTVDVLRAHVEGEGRSAGEPLFLTGRSYQWTTAHIGRVFGAAARSAGVTGHSPKSLRHFYASLLIRAGESVAVVQSRLGHASAAVTLEVYVHLWEDAHDTTRAAVSGVFDDGSVLDTPGGDTP